MAHETCTRQEALWAFVGRGMSWRTLFWRMFLVFFVGPLAVGSLATSDSSAWAYGGMYAVATLSFCASGRHSGYSSILQQRVMILPASTARLAVLGGLLWYATACGFLLAACGVAAGFESMPCIEMVARSVSISVVTVLGALGLGGVVGGTLVIGGTWALVLYARGFVLGGSGDGWSYPAFVIQILPVVLAGGLWRYVRMGRLRRGARVWPRVGVRSRTRSRSARVKQPFGSVEAAQRWSWWARSRCVAASLCGAMCCVLACMAGGLCGRNLDIWQFQFWGFALTGWLCALPEFGHESLAVRMAMRAQQPHAVVSSYRKNGLLMVGALAPFAVLGLVLTDSGPVAVGTIVASAYVVAVLWGGQGAWLTSWGCAIALWLVFLLCGSVHATELDPDSIPFVGDMVRSGAVPRGVDCVISWGAAAAVSWSAVMTFKEAVRKGYVGRVECVLATCTWAVLVVVPWTVGLGWLTAVGVPTGWGLSVAVASLVVGQYAELPLFVAAGRRVGNRWLCADIQVSRGRRAGENW